MISSHRDDHPPEHYAWGQIYLRDLEDFELSVRTMNGLKRAKCRTVYDVAKARRVDLLRVKGLGIRSLAEIDEALSPHDVSIGELA